MYVSIPLKSGHYVIAKEIAIENNSVVSIPLKSGHYVIATMAH